MLTTLLTCPSQNQVFTLKGGHAIPLCWKGVTVTLLLIVSIMRSIEETHWYVSCDGFCNYKSIYTLYRVNTNTKQPSFDHSTCIPCISK